MKLMTSLSLALLILAETFTTTSGKFLRVEEPNIPPNATLMSLGFSGVDPSIPGDTKVMMVERLEGQGRVAWIDEWKEAWLDERFMKKREADEVRVEAWQKTWLIGQRRKASSRSAKSRKPMDIGVAAREMRGIEMTLDWQTAYKNHKNISTTIAPPSFFTDQLLVRNRRLFWNNFFVGKDSKGGAKELPHRTIQISRYDIFISRYGMYIFIPAMMTFTLMYVLCLKWKCLDTDLVGIHGVSAIFQSAGRRMLHRLSPSVRKDPLLGKMYVVKHGSKMEERKIKELFRGVSGMGRNII